jgi:CheY-like chemotaxis protein
MMAGMSGAEFYSRVADADLEVAQRVVFMTGGINGPQIADFLDAIPNSCLEKPFEAEAFRAMVLRRLGLPSRSTTDPAKISSDTPCPRGDGGDGRILA